MVGDSLLSPKKVALFFSGLFLNFVKEGLVFLINRKDFLFRKESTGRLLQNYNLYELNKYLAIVCC